MKKIGTIKFYKEWENLLKSSGPYYFKDSFMYIILDYLNNYEITEIDLAMDNIKKYFYPEFFQFHESIRRHYPTIIEMINYFYKSIGNDVLIYDNKVQRAIKVTDRFYENFANNFDKSLMKLVVVNINERSNRDKFNKSIINYCKNLDALSDTISNTMLAFMSRYILFDKSQLSLIKYMEYADSNTNCRNFCKNKAGKNFHIDKILKMNNGELNPVIYFCGGLGCIHIWEPNPLFKEK